MLVTRKPPKLATRRLKKSDMAVLGAESAVERRKAMSGTTTLAPRELRFPSSRHILILLDKKLSSYA